jgi:adenylate cyclase
MGGHRLHAAIAVVLAGLWGGLLGFGQFNGDAWFLERVEATLVDLRTLARGVRPAPPNVLIVAIDDETVRIEGGYPVSRKTLSGIVDAVAALGPNVVALDILLLDAGIADEDRALAASLARSRSVLAGAAVFGTSRVTAPAYPGNAFAAVPVADRFVLPREAFAENAAIGIVNLATDHAGTPRFVPMVFRDSSRIELAFPLQAASMALDVAPEFETDRVLLGARRIATDIGQRLPIGYYGPRGTVETVSAAAVIAGGLDRRQVEGRVVVIGATVIGSGDVFPTPFDPVMPGVEVISTAISNMLAGDGLVRNRSTRLADAGTAIVLPMLFVALLAWRRSLLGLAAIAVVLLAWLAANFALFKAGTWLSVSLPLAAGFPAAVLFGAFHIWQDRRLASALARRNEILQRFQAPALREWLEKDPLFLAEPVRQEAAVVFIDLFRLHRPQPGHERCRDTRPARRFLPRHRAGDARPWRRHHQLHGRRRHDRLRPAASRLPVTPPTRLPAPPHWWPAQRNGSTPSRRRAATGSASSSAHIAVRSSHRVSAAAASSRSPRPATPSTSPAG